MTNKVHLKGFFLIIFCLCSFSSYASTQDRLSSVLIHKMTYLETIGFFNCDSQTSGGLNQGELLMINHLIRNDDIVIDAGANRGDWSASVLKHAPLTLIHAFEPIPEIYNSLKGTFSSASNVHLHQLALFSSNGEKVFTYYSDLSGLSTIFERKSVSSWLNLNPTFIPVKTQRLDDFCKEHFISHIDYLKIDTEGSEVDILFGAMNLLNNQAINFIQFEYGETYIDAKTTLKLLYDLLAVNHYTLYKISEFGLIEISKWDDRLENYGYANFLAVKN